MDRPVTLTDRGEIQLQSGRKIRGNGGEEFIVPLESFGDVGLSALARIWSKEHDLPGVTRDPSECIMVEDGNNLHHHDLEELLVSLDPPEEFDEKWSTASQVSLTLTSTGHFAIRVLSQVPGQVTANAIANLIRPQVEMQRGQILRIEVLSGVREYSIDVWIDYPTRGKTLIHAYSFGDQIADLIGAIRGDFLTLETAWGLLQGGHGAALIGQEECAWLDVKSAAYNLDDVADKVELAQDVARFANAEGGGLLIVGMRTRRVDGTEKISALTRTSVNTRSPRRYRDVIDKRVHPPIDGLAIRMCTTPIEDLLLLAALVPPQGEENKPFLVHGAIVGNRYEGGFISIVRRRGEESIPISGPAIHSTLAAGRALLRGR